MTTDRVAEPFSRGLRVAIEDGHARAQGSVFVEALVAGQLNLDGYTALASQHYFIYSALEAAGDAMAEHPVAGRFVFDALRRVPALSDDLAELIGPDWRDRIEPRPSTAAYVARLTDVAAVSPTAFVAHHYTRYLGDIAGGQVVRAQLRAQHGFTDAGARFYDFSAIAPVPTFRKRYRELLDTAPWSADERAEVIAEAGTAFDHNVAVLTDLAADLPTFRAA